MNTHPSETLLNELVDGTLSPEERSRADAHVATCLPCAARVRQIESLLERARALPRDIAPPAAAWEEIQKTVRSPGAPERRPEPHRSRWALVAAAAVLVAATASTVWMLRGDSERSGTPPSYSAAPATLATFAPVEARYVLAASELEQTLEEKRPMLDPATIATVERSLTTIDGAIAEARAALMRDPGNGTLSRLLASSYEQKVTLLRRASELTPRS
jgi:hypothetical protein